MKKLLIRLFRSLGIRKFGRRPELKILPLSAVSSVALYIPECPDRDSVAADAREFFGARGIDLNLLCPGINDINPAGYLRRRVREPKGSARREDLFISLSSSPNDYAWQFEGRCTPAAFRISCCAPEEEGLFNMVVKAKENSGTGAADLFRYIKKQLLIIK